MNVKLMIAAALVAVTTFGLQASDRAGLIAPKANTPTTTVAAPRTVVIEKEVFTPKAIVVTPVQTTKTAVPTATTGRAQVIQAKG